MEIIINNSNTEIFIIFCGVVCVIWIIFLYVITKKL